jgi:hypothetical protein
MAIVDIKKPKTANQLAKLFGGDVKTIKKLNNLSKGQTISGPVKLGRGVGTNAKNRVITPSATARSLYVDPTPMYQPAMDFINKQVGQANQRYAANQADIKTIFGNLTTVRAEDKQKIQDQFTKSIADQQMSLATRTAEARAGSEAGAQQLAVTAGERGGGEMPTATPVQQAAEEGIARSNEYQQTWEALQNVMSQQAQNDVTTAVRGYDYQQASALEQLRNNLEERLSGLEAQGVDVRTQLAGAQLQGQQNVMQANYGEIQNREAQRAALAAAQARSAGTVEAARIRAEADANKPPSYSRDIYGWEQKVSDAGIDPSAIRNDIAAIVQRYRKANNSEQPSAATIYQKWQRKNPNDPTASLINEYIRYTY